MKLTFFESRDMLRHKNPDLFDSLNPVLKYIAIIDNANLKCLHPYEFWEFNALRIFEHVSKLSRWRITAFNCPVCGFRWEEGQPVKAHYASYTLRRKLIDRTLQYSKDQPHA